MLADGLARQGHFVTLVVPESEVPTTIPDNWQVAPFSYTILGSPAASLGMAAPIATKVAQVCSEREFDLLYFAVARHALVCRHSAFDGPILGGVHGYYFTQVPFSPFGLRGYYADWPKRWLYYQIGRVLEWLTYRRLDGLIFNSKGTQERIVSAYGLSSLDQAVCYYGIQTATEIQSKWTKEPIVLFVGGNHERKGLPTLLHALPAILRQHPEHRLIVVGNHTNQHSMEQLAANLRVQDKVDFVGYQPNEVVQEWHQRAKVFVMPSLMEGFGIVFLEAMRAGTPVIATRVGGIPEVVIHGENGLLVSPNQPAELAESCIRLLSDPDLYDRLAAGGRDTVAKFPPERMIQATEDFFQHMITQYHG